MFLSHIKNNAKNIFFWGFVALLFPTSLLASAHGLVPCTDNCGYNEFIELIGNVINWLLLIAAPIGAIMAAYAGWLYITSGGSETKAKQANSIFTTLFFGILIALSAWLVVKLILDNLVTEEFSKGLSTLFLSTGIL